MNTPAFTDPNVTFKDAFESYERHRAAERYREALTCLEAAMDRCPSSLLPYLARARREIIPLSGAKPGLTNNLISWLHRKGIL